MSARIVILHASQGLLEPSQNYSDSTCAKYRESAKLRSYGKQPYWALHTAESADVKVKVDQSHYRPEVPRGFQEVKVPRLRDNGPVWW